MDCSPPDSSVHGILQIRILEWRAILFSRGSFQPRDQTLVSYIAARFFTIWATQVASYIRPFHFPLKSYIFNVLPCIFHPFFFFMILHFGVSSELSSSVLYFSSAVCYREFLIIFIIFFALTHMWLFSGSTLVTFPFFIFYEFFNHIFKSLYPTLQYFYSLK